MVTKYLSLVVYVEQQKIENPQELMLLTLLIESARHRKIWKRSIFDAVNILMHLVKHRKAQVFIVMMLFVLIDSYRAGTATKTLR